MASVLLPTREWAPACDELVEQATHRDEVLVLCDTPDDGAMAAVDRPGVTVIAAGEPDGCSGKANALAAGLEAASDDLIICTDADFTHGPGWLERIRTAADRHGAVTGVPLFASESRFGMIVEPALAFRADDVDVDALVADLRRTVSDDMLVGEHLRSGRIVDTELASVVPIPGTPRQLRHRLVRFARTVRFTDVASIGPILATGLACLIGLLFAPLAAFAVATAVVAVLYVYAGYRRPSFVLALPSFIVVAVLFGYGLLRTEFEWGGRRYRWRRKFDVEILG